MKIKKQRILLIAGTLILVGALKWSYASIVSPVFGYQGFSFAPLPLGLELWSWWLAVIPSLWMPIGVRRPSGVVYWVLYVVVYVPCSFVPLQVVHMKPGEVELYQLALFGAFALLGSIATVPVLKLPILRVNRVVFWAAFGAVYLTFYGRVLASFGVPRNPFAVLKQGLDQTYAIRAVYGNIVRGAGGVAGYVSIWTGNVLNPFLIAQGLVRANLVWIGVGVFGQLAMYSIAGFKTMLLSIVVLIAIFAALRSEGRYFGLFVVYGLIFLVLLSCAFYFWFGWVEFPSYVVRRMLFVPAQLTAYYFEFFSDNSKMLLSHSVLKGLVTSTYGGHGPSWLINAFYYARDSTGANANIWADGYANFSYWGVFGYTLMLGGVLWLLDSAAWVRKCDFRLACLMAVLPSLTLANAALLTTLLTHGFLFIVLLLLLVPLGEGRNHRQ